MHPPFLARFRWPPPLDVVLAGCLALALVIITPRVPAGDSSLRAVDAPALVLVTGAAASLAWRRVAPRLVLALSTGAVALYAVADYVGGPVYVAPLVALFTIANLGGRRAATGPAVAAALTLLATSLLRRPADVFETVHLLWISWAVAAVLIGDAARNRALQVAALRERARVLEETREEEARRRVAEERVRIARDLHDVVAHSLASISIQAGMGAHVIGRRPEEARAALVAIRRASKEALEELRATLDVLRDSDGDGAAPRAPTGLADLDALTTVARRSGVPLTVEVTGLEGRHVPAAVDVTAYRIVQESLTNVMRHAGEARAEVRVSWHDDVLEVEVVDDGCGATAGPAGSRGGHGLVGMRERAALVGGRVAAGPRPGGWGFRVHAELPVPHRSADAAEQVRA